MIPPVEYPDSHVWAWWGHATSKARRAKSAPDEHVWSWWRHSELEPHMIADAQTLAAASAGAGRGAIIVGGCVLDRITDPTLSHRVREAQAGDRAAYELIRRVFRDASGAGRVADLPLQVRLYIDGVRNVNDGRLPAFKAGRPKGDHRSFATAVAFEVELARGSTVTLATAKLKSYGRVTAQAIKKARRKWRGTREMAVEMQQRRREAKQAGRPNLPPVDLAALAALEPAPMQKPPRCTLK